MLVLDEPEQNLDTQGREWLATRLMAERAAGVAVVLASHHQTLVDQIADRELELSFGDTDPEEHSSP